MPDDKYIEELKALENGIRKGFRNGKWYPHKSVEDGGTQTVAYGHLLTKDDVASKRFDRGISEDEATAMLKEDIANSEAVARTSFDKRFGSGSFDALPPNMQTVVVDYTYNGVGSKFPKMFSHINEYAKATDPALKQNHLDGAMAEHKRHYTAGGKKKELTARNEFTSDLMTLPPAQIPEEIAYGSAGPALAQNTKEAPFGFKY
jgi:hypothetical protein